MVYPLVKYKRGLLLNIFDKNQKTYWVQKQLKEIASFCGGGTPSKDVTSYWSGNIGWVSSSDIQDEWIDTISITRRINKAAIENSSTKLCPKGSIAIVSRVGVGKVAIMPENLCTSQDFTNIISLDGNKVFFAYQIAFKMKIETTKTQGTSIKGITSDTIKRMMVHIPPQDEQEHIAAFLTAVDLKLKYELRLFDSLSGIKKALLQKLFI